jgi:monoamine oxidase
MDGGFLDRRALLKVLGGALAAGVVPAAASDAAAAASRRVVIIGAGIAGLVAALEVERHGGEAILVEARDRVGGRAWTVRGGDRIEHIGEDPQVAAFAEGLYLNAGAARIPSHHDQYLGLCRDHDVPLEVLVNATHSAFLAAGDGKRIRLRQAGNDLRGHLSALLERGLRQGSFDQAIDPATRAQLATFLKLYGDLADDGSYRGSERSGLARVPGATSETALAVPPETLDALLADPQLPMILFEENILMQATMLHPVGGMDRLPIAIAAGLRTPVHLGQEVVEIRRRGQGVRIVVRDRRSGADRAIDGDRAIITSPLPILARTPNDFSPAVRRAIAGVTYSDSIKIAFESAPFWEADQVYGGQSFPGGDTGAIWYPSGTFQRPRQILLAAYASRNQVQRLALLGRAGAIEAARAAVERIHPGHGRGLEKPVLVRWSRIPFSEGPWIEWSDNGNDPAAATLLNAGDGPFLFAGSHLSQYSGHWQEGAILSARYAVGRLALPIRQ